MVANANVKAGFILEDGHYTPIVFLTWLNEDFDYSKQVLENHLLG